MKIIKRPLIIIAIGCVLGILYGLYLEISVALSVILIIFSLIAVRKDKRVLIKIFRNKRVITTLVITMVCFAIYILVQKNQYEKFYTNDGKDIMIDAVISSSEQGTGYYDKYIVKVKGKKLILYTKDDSLKYGTKVRIFGKYSEPEDVRNYKGLSYKKLYQAKKIYGTIKSENIQIIKLNNISPMSKISAIARDKITETIKEILPKKTQGLLRGILIGDKSDIDMALQIDFKVSSLLHLLAISGTHVLYVILGINFVLSKLKIPKRITYYLVDLILIFFMYLTSFTASVVRASIMGILMTTSKIVYRKADSLTSMAVSLIIILIYNPFSIFDIGLQLTFLGTLGIMTLNMPIRDFLQTKISPKIAKVISIPISVQIMILPVMILSFHSISLTFLISNILAVPLTGAIILYGYANVIVGLVFVKIAKIFAMLLNFLLSLLILIARFVSKMKLSNIYVVTPNIIFIFLYYLAIGSIKNKKVFKCVIAILLILMLFSVIYEIIPKKLEIHMVDVGQGDCELIITPKGKTILVDSGEKEGVLLDYLLNMKVKKLDYVIVSHFDSDHCYNLIGILKDLKVKNIIVSRQAKQTDLFGDIMQECKKKKVNIITVEANQKFEIEKSITLDFMWPCDDEFISDDLNNNSIVMKLNYKEFSILLTGDIEEKAEQKIVRKYLDGMLKSTVLKVAHHGSKTSSTQRFIDEVSPQIAIIGVRRG